MAIVTQNQIGVFPVGAAVIPSDLVDTQFFSANGNWDGATAVAAGATFVDILIVGGGGGGASGERGGNGNGGDGGMPGSFLYLQSIPIDILSLTESFVSGLGGSGGAAVLINDTLGNPGASGSSSSFYTLNSPGGAGASGSTTTSEPIGTLYTGHYSESLIFILNSVSGHELVLSRGGGSGGSHDQDLLVSQPGASSELIQTYLQTAAVISAGGTGAAGENGKPYATYFATGGAGGGSNDAGTLTFPGGSGLYGSGGGGGSPAENLNNSGAGGSGGNGVLVVFAYK